MLDIFTLWFQEMPGWVSAELALIAFVVFMIGFLLSQQKQLSWYLAPLLVMSLMMAYFNSLLPDIHSWMISVRSDWSLLHLIQSENFYSVVVQLVFMGIFYGMLAIMVFFSFALWSLLSFRWDRFQILWRRGMTESWLVFWFVLMTMSLFWVMTLWVPTLSLVFLEQVLQCFAVLFVLQLSIRMLDSAHFQTPQVFMLLHFWMGMLLISALWIPLGVQYIAAQISFQQMFWQQLMLFFVMMLAYGFLAGFLLSARFSRRKRSGDIFVFWKRWMYALLRQRSLLVYIGSFLGMLVIQLGLVTATSYGLLLFFPFLFVGYFLLFCWNDFQEDLRKKGWLVEDRRYTEPENISPVMTFLKPSHL